MRLLSESTFCESKKIFQDFLIAHNCTGKILWLFEQDVRQKNDQIFLKGTGIEPVNEELTRRLYEVGLERNLGVSFQAFAVWKDTTCCYAYVPFDDAEAESLAVIDSID